MKKECKDCNHLMCVNRGKKETICKYFEQIEFKKEK